MTPEQRLEIRNLVKRPAVTGMINAPAVRVEDGFVLVPLDPSLALLLLDELDEIDAVKRVRQAKFAEMREAHDALERDENGERIHMRQVQYPDGEWSREME